MFQEVPVAADVSDRVSKATTGPFHSRSSTVEISQPLMLLRVGNMEMTTFKYDYCFISIDWIKFSASKKKVGDRNRSGVRDE